ncbi:MAG: GNAT family N-acetyltransferase [Candidatus Dormibacteraeota bacterium]|nr:GNAT family N-acetyltransferase [Candidatus Dormibacteraeota bacterium]
MTDDRSLKEHDRLHAVDAVLKDGSTVHLRTANSSDREMLAAFYESLSLESRYLRFFGGISHFEHLIDRWIEGGALGLVALQGGHPVGHAYYGLISPRRAEAGFAVADRMQGHGLGTLLVGQLAAIASAAGVEEFEATVLAENHQMLDVFRDSGFPIRTRSKVGEIGIEFPTSLSAEARRRFEDRDRLSAVSAMRSFLQPGAVAVVGASRDPASIGGRVFHNLLSSGYPGPVHAVNPAGGEVESVSASASIGDAPGPVELAVVVVPKGAVATVARECAAKGVRSLVVISSGFAETGEDGAERQAELVSICRTAGMRLIGPNCMGIMNTDPAVRLNVTFGPSFPPHGRVGFMSQSGALGLAVIDHARALGIGLSSFVSVGNKADISGNDLLQYWEEDPATDVCILYLESFGNPRKFARVARRVSRRKPIVAVKSGRSAAGARATSSHTGALLAASEVTVDALFRQAGVIRTDTLSELFDAVKLLATQPLPGGSRVAIVTNAGGPGILCADSCEAAGLRVPELSEDLQAQLRPLLAAEASTANPVDMIASATPHQYRTVLELVAGSAEADAVIVIFIPPLAIGSEEVATAIRSSRVPGDVSLLSVFMSSEQLTGPHAIPTYSFPEEAARALGHAVHYSTWRRTPEGQAPVLGGISADEAKAVLATAIATGGGWMEPVAVLQLLACYGLSPVESRVAGSALEAARAAAALKGPVALKAIGPGLLHKTEAGAVRLGLRGREAVLRAATEMETALRGAGQPLIGFLVQRMASGGIEMLVGVVNDPSFGPVLACGAGGTATELVKDIAVRITPLTEEDARAMPRALATFPLLDGYRGAPRADVGALEQLLLRVSELVESNPEIAEIDLNPVIVHTSGVSVVDARVRLQEARSQPLPGTR